MKALPLHVITCVAGSYSTEYGENAYLNPLASLGSHEITKLHHLDHHPHRRLLLFFSYGFLAFPLGWLVQYMHVT